MTYRHDCLDRLLQRALSGHPQGALVNLSKMVQPLRLFAADLSYQHNTTQHNTKRAVIKTPKRRVQRFKGGVSNYRCPCLFLTHNENRKSEPITFLLLVKRRMKKDHRSVRQQSSLSLRTRCVNRCNVTKYHPSLPSTFCYTCYTPYRIYHRCIMSGKVRGQGCDNSTQDHRVIKLLLFGIVCDTTTKSIETTSQLYRKATQRREEEKQLERQCLLRPPRVGRPRGLESGAPWYCTPAPFSSSR